MENAGGGVMGGVEGVGGGGGMGQRAGRENGVKGGGSAEEGVVGQAGGMGAVTWARSRKRQGGREAGGPLHKIAPAPVSGEATPSPPPPTAEGGPAAPRAVPTQPGSGTATDAGEGRPPARPPARPPLPGEQTAAE